MFRFARRQSTDHVQASRPERTSATVDLPLQHDLRLDLRQRKDGQGRHQVSDILLVSDGSASFETKVGDGLQENWKVGRSDAGLYPNDSNSEFTLASSRFSLCPTYLIMCSYLVVFEYAMIKRRYVPR